MVQRSEHLRFPCEPRHALRVRSDRCRPNLNRYIAAQPGIRGALHFANAAFAQLTGDAIMRDRLPYHDLRESECSKIRTRDSKSGRQPSHRVELPRIGSRAPLLTVEAFRRKSAREESPLVSFGRTA